MRKQYTERGRGADSGSWENGWAEGKVRPQTTETTEPHDHKEYEPYHNRGGEPFSILARKKTLSNVYERKI